MRYANLFAKVLADILRQTFLFVFASLRHEYPWIIERATIKRSNRRDTLFALVAYQCPKAATALRAYVCVCRCGKRLQKHSPPPSPGWPIFLHALSAPHWHSINIYLRLGGLFRERAAHRRSFIRESAFLSLSFTYADCCCKSTGTGRHESLKK